MPAPQVQDAPAAAAAAADLGTATRADFPILHQSVNERPLMYLDNAATSQKPRQVLQTMDEYYGEGGYNSNVHRGVHALSARATAAYEAAREKIAGFINASSPQEIVYTRNATEAINLVANTWGAAQLREGDEVVLSVAEHHSNIVPWQLLAQRRGLVLKFAELTGSEEVDLEKLAALITPRTRLVSLVHVSNMLGCVLPTQRVAEMAHGVGAKLLLDCCQSGGAGGKWEGQWLCQVVCGSRAASGWVRSETNDCTSQCFKCWTPSCWPCLQCPTCWWMCRRLAPTGLWPLATRCAALQASASCGPATRCWSRCRRGWVVAR